VTEPGPTDGPAHPGRRAALLVAAAVVLAVAAVVLLVAGVEVRETTGGLLVTPIRQVHLVGGALLGGTAAGVAAVLTTLAAVPALRRARRHRGPAPDAPRPSTSPRPDTGTDGVTVADIEGPADPAAATSAPGADRRP
jgi:hypothetical protein